VASDYDRYRPAPPPQALDWLVPAAARAVLDLAAGTGVVTRELVRRAAGAQRVIAVEPDERMRAVLAAGRGAGTRLLPVFVLRFSSGRGAEVAQNGEHAAVVALIRREAELAEDAGHVLFDGTAGYH
jgi:SAM-dependent methyltransferase